MVGGLWEDAHFQQDVADVAADVLAVVLGRRVKVPCLVVGHLCQVPVLILSENIELDLGAEVHLHAHLLRMLYRLLQEAPAVPGICAPVRAGDVAEHPDDCSVHGPPGDQCHRGRIRLQEQIAPHAVLKPGDGTPVKGDAFLESPLQLMGHDRKILLLAENIKKSQADKLYVFILHQVPDLIVLPHSLAVSHPAFSVRGSFLDQRELPAKWLSK